MPAGLPSGEVHGQHEVPEVALVEQPLALARLRHAADLSQHASRPRRSTSWPGQ